MTMTTTGRAAVARRRRMRAALPLVWLRTMLDRIAEHNRVWREAERLRELSDRALWDIGLTRGEVEASLRYARGRRPW